MSVGLGLGCRKQSSFHGVKIYSQLKFSHKLTRRLNLLRSSFISAHLFKVFSLLGAKEHMNVSEMNEYYYIAPNSHLMQNTIQKKMHSPAERV